MQITPAFPKGPLGQSPEWETGVVCVALTLQGSLRGGWATIIWEVKKIIDNEKLGKRSQNGRTGLEYTQGKKTTI